MLQGKDVREVDVAVSYQCKSGVGSDLRFPFAVLRSQSLLGCLHSPVQVLSGTGPVVLNPGCHQNYLGSLKNMDPKLRDSNLIE